MGSEEIERAELTWENNRLILTEDIKINRGSAAFVEV